MIQKYRLGNYLRGYFTGEFESIDEAWSYLSNRFLLSFPSNSGRFVTMTVNKINEYGFEDNIVCKQGITEINDLQYNVVMEKTIS